MRSYKETLNNVRENISKGLHSFPEYERLDYTGVGFGYNFQKSYPDTLKKAEEDMAALDFEKFIGEFQ